MDRRSACPARLIVSLSCRRDPARPSLILGPTRLSLHWAACARSPAGHLRDQDRVGARDVALRCARGGGDLRSLPVRAAPGATTGPSARPVDGRRRDSGTLPLKRPRELLPLTEPSGRSGAEAVGDVGGDHRCVPTCFTPPVRRRLPDDRCHAVEGGGEVAHGERLAEVEHRVAQGRSFDQRRSRGSRCRWPHRVRRVGRTAGGTTAPTRHGSGSQPTLRTGRRRRCRSRRRTARRGCRSRDHARCGAGSASDRRTDARRSRGEAGRGVIGDRVRRWSSGGSRFVMDMAAGSPGCCPGSRRC